MASPGNITLRVKDGYFSSSGRRLNDSTVAFLCGRVSFDVRVDLNNLTYSINQWKVSGRLDRDNSPRAFFVVETEVMSIWTSPNGLASPRGPWYTFTIEQPITSGWVSFGLHEYQFRGQMSAEPRIHLDPDNLQQLYQEHTWIISGSVYRRRNFDLRARQATSSDPQPALGPASVSTDSDGDEL